MVTATTRLESNAVRHRIAVESCRMRVEGESKSIRSCNRRITHLGVSSKTSVPEGGSRAAVFTLRHKHSKFVKLYIHGDENISKGELPHHILLAVVGLRVGNAPSLLGNAL